MTMSSHQAQLYYSLLSYNMSLIRRMSMFYHIIHSYHTVRSYTEFQSSCNSIRIIFVCTQLRLCMQDPEATPLLSDVANALVEDAPLPLGTGSNVMMFDLDEDNKAKANVVVHGIIVSLAGGTLDGWLIEEGNVSMCMSSIEPGAKFVLLYEGNDDDDPPVVRLGDAMKSITKWPMETLKAIPEEPQQAS